MWKADSTRGGNGDGGDSRYLESWQSISGVQTLISSGQNFELGLASFLQAITIAADGSWPTNDTSEISRMVLDVSGQLKLQSWSEDDKKWNSSESSSRCGDYALCGDFSLCNETAEVPCGCLKGFEPDDADAWSNGDASSGCVRKTALQCINNQKDGFLKMSKVDWTENPLGLDIRIDKECQSACLNNCSCIAYAYVQKPNRTGVTNSCLVWNDSLLNLKQLSDDDKYGNDFYLKLALSDLVPIDTSSRNGTSPAVTSATTDQVMPVGAKQLIVILTISLPLATLTLGLLVYCAARKLRRKGEKRIAQNAI
ncbi:g-type lectin s-receptor-like serine/threonine-protein kinase sd1-13 [Fagus crenata]